MPINQFSAFYPSKPIWVGSRVDVTDKTQSDWFRDQMSEEVFSEESESYVIKACRDGLIMLRVLELEKHMEDMKVDEAIQTWNRYLRYLNTLYLLLESSIIENERANYLSLQEINRNEVIRLNSENGKSTCENFLNTGHAFSVSMLRSLDAYKIGRGWIHRHPMLSGRKIVSIPVLQKACDSFSKAFSLNIEDVLSSFLKSLSEYKSGNYGTSIILSWFLIEKGINEIWRDHLETLNVTLPNGKKRINADRKKNLTGRDRGFKSEVHQPGSEPLPAFEAIAPAENSACPSSSRSCNLL
jgi:hypothetical protein